MKKKLLMLNRRDIKNPLGGGAEIYTHEILKRLVDKFDIIVFCSRGGNTPKNEIIDNIEYKRYGNELTVHFYAIFYLLFKAKSFEVIIDQFNGIGFWGFLFRAKTYLLIHQLYDDFWVKKLGKIGYIFKKIELLLLKLYRNMKVITVSPSTKSDLLKLGFKEENIKIVYNGLDDKIIYTEYLPKKEFSFQISYLGRLAKTKNPEDVIKVFLLLKKIYPKLILNIVGEGEEKERLMEKYFSEKDIKFWGYVDEKTKYEILRISDFLIVPSVREGWGQIVIQANIVGTPCIGYNVSGIKDSIKDKETGFLVEYSNFEKIAKLIDEFYQGKYEYEFFSRNCIEYAKKFNWAESAKIFLKLFQRT